MVLVLSVESIFVLIITWFSDMCVHIIAVAFVCLLTEVEFYNNCKIGHLCVIVR